MPDSTQQAQDNAAAATGAADAGLPANPFDDASWSSTPITPAATQDTATPPAADPPKQDNTPSDPPSDEADQVVDANQYLKEHLGFEDWETAKTQIKELRERKPEIEFANEQSKKLFEAIKANKKEELFSILDQELRLSKAESLDVTKATDAAEILKLNLKMKHKNLTPDEVDFMFSRTYSMPSKPVQSLDQTDEEYEDAVTAWENQVKSVEKSMIIEAKMAQPELAKYKSDIVLPDIPKEPVSKEPTPEELAQAAEYKTAFLSEIGKALSDLSSIDVQYKDEEVELPIKYEITQQERAKIKPILESLYSDFSYFAKRWSNPDGSMNGARIVRDLVLLESEGKVLQKLVNEAGTQRLIQLKKGQSNIHLGSTPPLPGLPAGKTPEEALMDQVWSN